jgi:hypothetical protein
MSLDKVFDVVPIEVNTDNPVVMQQGDPEDVDLDYARGNMYELLEKSKAALNTAIKVAAESENPRAIEVLSNLMKNMSDMNRTLLGMTKDREDTKSVKAQRKAPSQPSAQQMPQINSQQTVVFTGTSADLAKLLAEK